MFLDNDQLKEFERSTLKKSSDVIRNAIMKNGIERVALNNTAVVNMRYTFSKDIKTGKVTSQKRSGRCWMFAGLNLFRKMITDELNIKDFELSQSFPMFYDKLEKANYFLESILKTMDEDIYSRIVMWLLKDPMQDGGQWDMFVNLVHKYGAVPKNIMPETYHSSNSYVMNKILTAKLRQYAMNLRDAHLKGSDEKQLRDKKRVMVGEFYEMLTYFLGIPPSDFDFEFRDENDHFNADRGLTPKTFYDKYIGIDLNNYVSIINAPTPDKPFMKTYTVDYLGNVVEGNQVLYLNLSNKEMKELTLKQLQNDEPVWFGCDITLSAEKQLGIMDTDIFLLEKALNNKIDLNKSERLLYGESLLTHAMVLTGVNVIDDKPNRWKVENSWGEERGEKGFFIMSDTWFDEYNYQVVINKKHLTRQQLEALEQKPLVLPPWDPMGSLALVNY